MGISFGISVKAATLANMRCQLIKKWKKIKYKTKEFVKRVITFYFIDDIYIFDKKPENSKSKKYFAKLKSNDIISKTMFVNIITVRGRSNTVM